jgi:AraC family transcriptional regulator, positive regulator of tynA and feaB
MRTVFSTEQVHPRDRFDYWMSSIRRNVINTDAEPARRLRFNAELQIGAIDAVKLVSFRTSALSVHHTARHVAQLTSDDVSVFVPLAGRMFLEQSGRQAVLNPGEFGLVDPTVPIEGRYSEDSEVLMLGIERRQLESRLGNVRAVMTRAVGSTTAEGRLAREYMAMLPSYAAGVGAAAARSIEVHLLDLLGLSVQNALKHERPRRSFARSAVDTRLRTEIEARLSDPALDPETVAHAAGVSVRYANSVLADENTSLGQLIQSRRLERCRQSLEDPEQKHRTVSEIAHCWGFRDMTHFGRRFRSAFDLLPSEFRRASRVAHNPIGKPEAETSGSNRPAPSPRCRAPVSRDTGPAVLGARKLPRK